MLGRVPEILVHCYYYLAVVGSFLDNLFVGSPFPFCQL